VWKKGPLKLSKNKDCAEKWEERVAFVLPPWERRISCFIEPAEAAVATYDSIIQNKRTQAGRETSLIFTDGTGFEGHIGAAAVNIHDHDAAVTSDRRHLGTESQPTVYAAELSGIKIALDRAIRDNKDISPTKAREMILFSDSQVAIQAVQTPQRPSGHYVITHIYKHVRTLRSRADPDNYYPPLDPRSRRGAWQ
jgi:ribonuclease HI